MSQDEIWRWVEERKWAYRGEWSDAGVEAIQRLIGSIRVRGKSTRKYPHSRSILLDPKPYRCGNDVRPILPLLGSDTDEQGIRHGETPTPFLGWCDPAPST